MVESALPIDPRSSGKLPWDGFKVARGVRPEIIDLIWSAQERRILESLLPRQAAAIQKYCGIKHVEGLQEPEFYLFDIEDPHERESARELLYSGFFRLIQYLPAPDRERFPQDEEETGWFLKKGDNPKNRKLSKSLTKRWHEDPQYNSSMTAMLKARGKDKAVQYKKSVSMAETLKDPQVIAKWSRKKTQVTKDKISEKRVEYWRKKKAEAEATQARLNPDL